MFGLSMPGVKASPNILGNVLAAVRGNKPTAFRVHELRNMTYAQRFAEQLPQILELPSGAYHFASQNGLSTYEAARLVASRLGCSEAEVDRLILPDQKTYAERPRDFRLASDKIQAAGIELGTFEEDLDRWSGGLRLEISRLNVIPCARKRRRPPSQGLVRWPLFLLEHFRRAFLEGTVLDQPQA